VNKNKTKELTINNVLKNIRNDIFQAARGGNIKIQTQIHKSIFKEIKDYLLEEEFIVEYNTETFNEYICITIRWDA